MSTDKKDDDSKKSDKVVTPARKSTGKSFTFNVPSKTDLKGAMGGGLPEQIANAEVIGPKVGEEVGELKKGELNKEENVVKNNSSEYHVLDQALDQEQGTKKESKEQLINRTKASTLHVNQKIEDIQPKQKKSVGRPEGKNYAQSSMTTSFRHDRWLEAHIFDTKRSGDPEYSKREALEHALDLLFDHVGLDENKVATILRQKEKYSSSKSR